MFFPSCSWNENKISRTCIEFSGDPIFLRLQGVLRTAVGVETLNDGSLAKRGFAVTPCGDHVNISFLEPRCQ